MAPFGRLDDAYITECEQRARQFSGAYTGTAGSLAAAVLHLLKERRGIMATLEEANQALRNAVTERMQGTPDSDPKKIGWEPPVDSCCDGGKCQPPADPTPEFPHDWILRGEQELREQQTAARQPAPMPAGTHPTSQEFYDLCDRLKEMHRRKSSDYGCPSGTDPLANIRNGARFVGIPDWKGAMVRLSDKVTRLATFNATGSLSFEGVEDNLLDLASYALLSLLLYREDIGKP